MGDEPPEEQHSQLLLSERMPGAMVGLVSVDGPRVYPTFSRYVGKVGHLVELLCNNNDDESTAVIQT